MDFFATISIVAKLTTIRILVVTMLDATEAIHNWFLHQIIDVNNAFARRDTKRCV